MPLDFLLDNLAFLLPLVAVVAQCPLGVGQDGLALTHCLSPRGQVGFLFIADAFPALDLVPQFFPLGLQLAFAEFGIAIEG